REAIVAVLLGEIRPGFGKDVGVGIDLEHDAEFTLPRSTTWKHVPASRTLEGSIRSLCGSCVAIRSRVQMTAGLAGAPFAGLVEAVKDGEEIDFDVFEGENLLEQLVVAALAIPEQAIFLVRQALALDNQANGIRSALRRMRNAWRQIEHL